MDFPKAYRKCKRTQALIRGLASVESCLAQSSKEYFKVEEYSLKSFRDIHGYRVSTADGAAFFPKDLSSIPPSSGMSWMGSAFSSVDIVYPPYYALGFLDEFAKRIHDAPDDDSKRIIGEQMLFAMYPTDGISQLICGVWQKRKTFEPYIDQLIETAKAYQLGLYGVAIVGLLPCIEGVLRRLGTLSGGSVEKSVDISSLLKVLRRLKSRELEQLVGEFSWYPRNELDVEYLNRFHERVQMLEATEVYFREALYRHTDSLPSYVVLNRHGIAHGFFDGYATAGNYLRLFNLLSSLSFAAILVEGRGSLLHPGDSDASKVLTDVLVRCLGLRQWVQ
jgi:hypothetical protein